MNLWWRFDSRNRLRAFAKSKARTDTGMVRYGVDIEVTSIRDGWLYACQGHDNYLNTSNVRSGHGTSLEAVLDKCGQEAREMLAAYGGEA